MINGKAFRKVRRPIYSLTLIGSLIVLAALLTAAVHAERFESRSPSFSQARSAVRSVAIANNRLGSASVFSPAAPPVLETVSTFDGGCSNPKTQFAVGDTDP